MVGHRCRDHKIDEQTETLIIGTFNPDTDANVADFFYGRPQNQLWRILPEIFNENSLKGRPREEKIRFIRARQIDFIDLIWEVDHVPPDYTDKYLDTHCLIHWREDIFDQIDRLPHLKRVGVSRKGFKDVRSIGNRVDEIAAHLNGKPIVFRRLHTPARKLNDARKEWAQFFKTDPDDSRIRFNLSDQS